MAYFKKYPDVSNDTVTAATLAEGVTAHDAAGNAIVGTMIGGADFSSLQFASATATGSTGVTTTVTLPDGAEVAYVLSVKETYASTSSSSVGKYGTPTIAKETSYTVSGNSLSVYKSFSTSVTYKGIRLAVIVLYTL